MTIPLAAHSFTLCYREADATQFTPVGRIVREGLQGAVFAYSPNLTSARAFVQQTVVVRLIGVGVFDNIQARFLPARDSAASCQGAEPVKGVRLRTEKKGDVSFLYLKILTKVVGAFGLCYSVRSSTAQSAGGLSSAWITQRIDDPNALALQVKVVEPSQTLFAQPDDETIQKVSWRHAASTLFSVSPFGSSARLLFTIVEDDEQPLSADWISQFKEDFVSISAAPGERLPLMVHAVQGTMLLSLPQSAIALQLLNTKARNSSLTFVHNVKMDESVAATTYCYVPLDAAATLSFGPLLDRILVEGKAAPFAAVEIAAPIHITVPILGAATESVRLAVTAGGLPTSVEEGSGFLCAREQTTKPGALQFMLMLLDAFHDNVTLWLCSANHQQSRQLLFCRSTRSKVRF